MEKSSHSVDSTSPTAAAEKPCSFFAKKISHHLLRQFTGDSKDLVACPSRRHARRWIVRQGHAIPIPRRRLISPSPEDPPSFPDTRPSLLGRLPDSEDADAWGDFVGTYGPLIYRFGLRRQLQPSDAADLVQEVMLRVARSIGAFRYDPERGRFRGWLFTITWRALIDRSSRANRRPDQAQLFPEEALADPEADFEALWDREYRRALLQRALPLVQPQFSDKTWDAFRLSTLEGLPAEDVARRLGVSVGAIYVARSRITARLRERILQIEAEWESRAAAANSLSR